MEKVHLKGRVLPSEPKISVANLPSLNWIAQEFGFSLDFTITIKDSSIDVECKLPEYKPEYLAEIHRRSYDLCRAAVNLAAFSTGCGWVIVFEHFIDQHGVQTPFAPIDPQLARLCTAF